MKGKTKILILLATVLAGPAFAQGTFRNLNFEEATLPYSSNAVGFVSAADAFPGWTIYRGGNVQAQVVYNGVSGQPPAVDLWSRDFAGIPVTPPSFGNFSAFIEADIRDGVPVSFGQAGTIPTNASSLRFDTFRTGSFNVLSLSFNGNPLGLQVLSPSFGIVGWGADVSAYAGQAGELRIAAVGLDDQVALFRFDNLQFSVQPVPEPSAWVLFLAGTVLLLAARRRRA